MTTIPAEAEAKGGRCCAACEKPLQHQCWRDGHVAVQDLTPITEGGRKTPKFRRYLCGQCGKRFSVPSCLKCGRPTIRVIARGALPIVVGQHVR